MCSTPGMEALAYSVEKTVAANQILVPAPVRSRVESAIAEVRKTVQGENAQAIKRSVDDLQRAAQGMAEAMSDAQAARSGGGGGPSNVADGEVIDAEPVESGDGR